MLEQENKKNYFAIIPSNVRYNKNISNGSKLLYAEITALTNEKGYCWANNEYFSKLYNVSEKTIKNWLHELESNNFILRKIENNNKRVIYINWGEKNFLPVGKNIPTSVKKNSPIINQNNNKINNKDIEKNNNEINFLIDFLISSNYIEKNNNEIKLYYKLFDKMLIDNNYLDIYKKLTIFKINLNENYIIKDRFNYLKKSIINL